MRQKWLVGLVCNVLPALGVAQQLPAAGNSAPTTQPRKATLQECYRVVKGDSVHLFYDELYRLVPEACAIIRREGHLTADGFFVGTVRDYWRSSGQPALLIQYRDKQQADGVVKQFHPNGQLAVQGLMTAGRMTGEWTYWYSDGQRQQVIQFLPEAGFRITSYWNSAGVQQVTDGNGDWEVVVADKRYRGPVEDGRQHGTWTSSTVATNELISTEKFVHGKFRTGTLAAASTRSGITMTSGSIWPAVEKPGSRGEEIQLGPTCK